MSSIRRNYVDQNSASILTNSAKGKQCRRFFLSGFFFLSKFSTKARNTKFSKVLGFGRDCGRRIPLIIESNQLAVSLSSSHKLISQLKDQEVTKEGQEEEEQMEEGQEEEDEKVMEKHEDEKEEEGRKKRKKRKKRKRCKEIIKIKQQTI